MIQELGLAVIAAIAWGLMDFFAKKVSAKLNPVKILMLVQAIEVILIVPIVLAIPPKQVNFTTETILGFLVVGILGAMGWIAFYKAIKLEKISIVGPIVASNAIVAVLTSTLFFNEKLSALQLSSVALVSLGIILVSLEFTALKKIELKLSNGVLLAIASMVLFGVVWPFAKTPVLNTSPEFAFLVIRAITLSIVAATYFLGKSEEKQKFETRSLLLPIALIAAFDAIALIAYHNAITTQLVAIVTPITQAYPVVTIGLAFFFLRERISAIQTIGIVFILLGVISLAV